MTNIIVTGASGFLGQHLYKRLRAMNYDPYPVSSKTYDLRRQAHLDALFKHTGKPDIIFHLAAHVGGIAYNIAHPASLYYDNVMINTQLIDKAAKVGSRLIFVGSVCSYPAHNPTNTQEARLWQGYPEESNGSYGVSKLVALAQLQAYRQQYGLSFAYPVLANLYGPGDRGFFEEDKAHVIPALIKRFSEASNTVTIWGDGSPSRDFLFVEDAAEALVQFLNIDYCRPVNIASGIEVSISRVAELIAKYTGFEGRIEYDRSKPGGQMRRCYDTYRAREVLGWHTTTTIEEGLRKTVEWYHSNHHHNQR